MSSRGRIKYFFPSCDLGIVFENTYNVPVRGFNKFLCRRSVGFFSRAVLVFLMKESKKKRRKKPSKLIAKSCSQMVNLPGARPLMNPLTSMHKLSEDHN